MFLLPGAAISSHHSTLNMFLLPGAAIISHHSTLNMFLLPGVQQSLVTTAH
jgi:hypothetical protein